MLYVLNNICFFLLHKITHVLGMKKGDKTRKLEGVFQDVRVIHEADSTKPFRG